MAEAPALYPRHMTGELREALGAARVVNVVGPRQVGKTTMVRTLFAGGRFVTLDDRVAREALEADPGTRLASLREGLADEPLIIDEIQRLKSLALDIKLIVDADRRPGQFLLTGSSNVFNTLEATDSLAGRMLTLTLWPLSLAEIERNGPSTLLDRAVANAAPPFAPGEVPRWERSRYVDLVLRGGYPEIRPLPDKLRIRRYRDYIDAVVDRDVADVLKVRRSDALRRLIEQLAARTSFEINLSDLSGIVGIKRQTLDGYLDVLARLSIVARLPAWSASESRRDIRSAKVHFTDSGVAAALRGLTSASFGPDADPTAFGGLLKTWVFGEIARSLPFQRGHFRLYHWRDRDGREVDLLAESAEGLVVIEVKAASSVARQDFRHLEHFATKGPGAGRKVVCLVVYLGTECIGFGDGLLAVPASALAGTPIAA